MPERVFMIQRDGDGLFSQGGSSPRFSRNGRIWTNIGHIKNHLRQVCGWRDPRTGSRHSTRVVPETHYLVEYELVEVRRSPLRDFVREYDL